MSPIVAQSIFFLKDFGQKVLQTWILRMREELVRLGLFQDLTLIHEEDTRGHLAGKIHLVRDNHHGHPFVRKLFHDLKHFPDLSLIHI